MPRIIKVFVHTKAHDEKIEETGLDEYEAWITSPPTDGEANADLIALISYQLGVPISSIHIKSGQKSRHKLIEID